MSLFAELLESNDRPLAVGDDEFLHASGTPKCGRAISRDPRENWVKASHEVVDEGPDFCGRAPVGRAAGEGCYIAASHQCRQQTFGSLA